MMARYADAFIGFRVPVPIKAAWLQEARRERRSLSNWIIHKIAKPQPSPDSTPRRRR
jgi:hypothetical protein